MMTAPVGNLALTNGDLADWRREARAYEDGYKQGIADQLGPTRRKLAEAGAAGALLVWVLGRRRHPLGALFILGALAALVAAVAIFPVLVALALVVGAAGYAACKGRRIPGYAYPLGLAAVILCGAAAPLSLALTLPAAIGAAFASHAARADRGPAELPPRTWPEAEPIDDGEPSF
ncbi:MAG: hypothetical protein ABSF73_10615 [Terriglobia bacterium]|jgi:hypothetical protein